MTIQFTDSSAKADDSIQTGDNTSMPIWISLLMASGAGIAVLTAFSRKKWCIIKRK